MEDELRRDAWKWENCLHTSVIFMGKTLRNPVLDIHYNARADGRDFAQTEKLPYALVISVHAKNLGDLYEEIIRKYAGGLAALRPVVETRSPCDFAVEKRANRSARDNVAFAGAAATDKQVHQRYRPKSGAFIARQSRAQIPIFCEVRAGERDRTERHGRAAVVIELVPADSLRETGVFAATAGDIRQFPPRLREISSQETKSNARKARISGLFPHQFRSRFWAIISTIRAAARTRRHSRCLSRRYGTGADARNRAAESNDETSSITWAN